MINDPIESLPNTSVITIRRLKSIGINTFWDFINYFPSRYEDYSLISPINKLQEGEIVTVTGKITNGQYVVTRNGTRMQKFKLEDSTGTVELTWFNQPYLLTLFKPGIVLSVAGLVRRFGNKYSIEPYEYEIGVPGKHTGRLIPIYSEKRGLSSKLMREKIHNILNQLDHDRDQLGKELYPKEILAFNKLTDEKSAYQNIHFPDSQDALNKSKQRLAFDELFTIQLTSALIKKEWEKQTVGHRFNVGTDLNSSLQLFINHLPFKLTVSQQKVWKEIENDLTKTKPMNRFLQGEVGSGKTVVAALACYLAYLNGYQSLIMAPTEILVQQHYQTLTNLFKDSPVKIGLQTGSQKICPVKTGQISNCDIVVGTHALISRKFSLDKIGFIVIDEQHRFGVAQRAKLKEKGINPHILTMTATPIPRTVALTLHGELDLSMIDEMPVGRLPIKTYLVPQQKRTAGYQWIKRQIKEQTVQAFIICPLIEESETETLQSVKAVTKEYEYLKSRVFPQLKLGLVHGKLKSKEKDTVMNDFKNRKYDILLATPVVEVGIDVPNATIMIIEGAERYGLAQMHQLRGRIGRGNKQSYCFLFTSNNDSDVSERLKYFAVTREGRLLAEKDLSIRGPGQIYGKMQHGYANLKIASFTDYALIKQTRSAAEYFINHYSLDKFPVLKERIEGRKIEEVGRD